MSHIPLNELIVIERVLLRIGTQPIAIKTAYHIGKLLKLVQEETKYFKETNESLIKSLGKERACNEAELKQGIQGPLWEVLPENIEQFSLKLKELLEVEITIDKWLLTLELLGELKISSNDMMSLDILIIESEKDKS